MNRFLLTAGLCLLLGACASSPPEMPPEMREFDFPTASPESQGLSSEALLELVEEVNKYVARDLIVGAELVVIQNRHVVLHECFGYADREDDVLWTKGTVGNIRSMTKPLTGAAVQILADRGELAIDDPVAKYLPGFDTDAAREITIRQLLTHRAGLPVTILQSMTDHENLIAMGNAVGAKGPETPPDARFWYSDSGTDALGALVEVVSGRKLDHFVHDALLAPLGMAESFYYLDAEDPRRARIASLYGGGRGNWQRFWNPDEKPFYPFAWGSQSLYSTPLDYAKFLAMWIDGGRVGDDVVLSEAAVERTLTPASEMTMIMSKTRFPTSYPGLEVYYGQMAVLHVPLDAHGAGAPTIIGHSGSDGTIAWGWPERDLMILYYTQSRGAGSALRLERAIARLLTDPEAFGGDDDVPEELRPYVGTYLADYANHMEEEFVVTVEGGKFLLDVPTQMVFELVPAAESGKWKFAISDEITVWFERDALGEVDLLRIGQGAMIFDVPRRGTEREREVMEATRAVPEDVGKYFGVYEDSESEGTVEVLIDGRYLTMRLSEGTDFHLWQVPGENAWVVKEQPMAVISFQEEGGVVVSATRRVRGQELVLPRIE